MKRSAVLVLFALLIVGSIGLWNGHPVSADGQTQGLWIFSDEISSLPARDTLVQRSAASGVTDLYLSVYHSPANSAGRLMYEDSDHRGSDRQGAGQRSGGVGGVWRHRLAGATAPIWPA